MPFNAPIPSKASLVSQYVGKTLQEIPMPAAVVDISSVKRNCEGMLRLKGERNSAVSFHPLIESHKTVEIARLQFGHDPEEVRFLVTNLSAADNLLPLLLDYQRKGIQVTIIYGTPISQSTIGQLANLIKLLGRQGGSVRVLVDHPSQFLLLRQAFQISGYPTYVYINIDVSGQHSGLQPNGRDFSTIFTYIEELALQDGPFWFTFVGLFCKFGRYSQSVDVSTAIQIINIELTTLLDASPIQGIRLSVSADQSLLCVPVIATSQSREPQLQGLSDIAGTVATISEAGHNIEIHTGDYCMSDIQNINALTNLGVRDSLFDKIGSMPLTILTEVISLYSNREGNLTQPLIAVGSEILGTKSEICTNWGIAKQWNLEPHIIASDHHHLGWVVSHVEKGSSILEWTGSAELIQPVGCGQRLRIHPNDSASASEAFGWYYVVDSTRIGREDEVVDIFVRWRT